MNLLQSPEFSLSKPSGPCYSKFKSEKQNPCTYSVPEEEKKYFLAKSKV